MVQAVVKSLSLEDFLASPDTEPESEYFDNEIIQKPMSGGKHSAIQGDLAAFVNSALRSKHIARALLELRCTFGGMSIVPDVSVFRWNRIVRDSNGEIANVFNIPPDWMVEILSPDQSQTKLVKKILFALENGTEIAWLIDPDEKVVFIYRTNQALQIYDRPEQLIPMPEFAGELSLNVATIFDWLSE